MTLKETNVVTEPAASAADINATRNVIYFPDTSIDIEKLARVDKDNWRNSSNHIFMQQRTHSK